MPGVSGVTVVTMLVCFFHFAREAAGALRARHSLRPLSSEEGRLAAKLAWLARRDRGRIFWRHCEEQRDEAIHACFLALWIASLALAMTMLGCLKFESVAALRAPDAALRHKRVYARLRRAMAVRCW